MPSEITAFGPGRVNLIGEHTDYNQGLALPFAISEGVTVRAQPLAERIVQAVALDLDGEDEFPLDDVREASGWCAFVRGAVAELARAGFPLCGTRLEISGTVPQGAGLSSSAALEVALTLALIGVADGSDPDRIELAKLCSRIENDWAGAQTGLLDQIASLFGEENRAMRIDFRSLDVTPVKLEVGDAKFVTLDSGEHHSNAASGYNQRRAECAEACQLLGLTSLRDATLDMADTLPEPLGKRVRHVVSDNQRVDEAVEALARGEVGELGQLLNAAHESLRDCYEISTPAVEAAVDRLRGAGALGARIIGGGFGGHVLGLLPADADPPEGAIEVRPGPGARLL